MISAAQKVCTHERLMQRAYLIKQSYDRYRAVIARSGGNATVVQLSSAEKLTRPLVYPRGVNAFIDSTCMQSPSESLHASRNRILIL